MADADATNANSAERDREAAAFVAFVLRHTWPERAKAHGAETVHNIIKHHPFAVSHATIDAASEK